MSDATDATNVSAEITAPADTTPGPSLAVRVACDIATGVTKPDSSATAISVVAASRNLNTRGTGHEWYRLVYRASQWVYFQEGRMPKGKFLASERRVTLYGDVYEGEILAGHPRGAAIESVRLVVDEPDDDGSRGRLISCEWSVTRAGIRVILPTGAHLNLPNPRR